MVIQIFPVTAQALILYNAWPILQAHNKSDLRGGKTNFPFFSLKGHPHQRVRKGKKFSGMGEKTAAP